MASFLDVVAECNKFSHNSSIWTFHLPGSSKPFGYILPHVATTMPWTSKFKVSRSVKQVTLLPSTHGASPADNATQAITELLAQPAARSTFPVITKWPNDHYAVLGAPFPLRMPCGAAGLFGIVTQGVHLTVYARMAASDGGQVKIWVARRGLGKPSYPGMYDQVVAGGIESFEAPLAALQREAQEEAALDLAKLTPRPVGTISFFNVKPSGPDAGLLEPGIRYCYDLEVDASFGIKPAEEDIEGFYLLTVDEVKVLLLGKKFKPNSGLVMLDFLVRHGLITSTDKNYTQIVEDLRRVLPMPTS